MSYINLDCNLYRNPKVLALGHSGIARDARGLYIAALMYSRSALTDGVIANHVINELDPALSPVQTRKAVLLLVCCGLLKRRKGRNSGWIIPDYARHQQTKEEVETAREQAKERKRRERERKASQRDTHDGHGVTVTPVTLQEESRREEKKDSRAVTSEVDVEQPPVFKIPSILRGAA